MSKPFTGWGWHFVRQDRRLGYDDGRRVKPGKTLRRKGRGEPTLCEVGMHASERALDALGYANLEQTICCRVRVTGNVDRGDDKFCGEQRRVAWMVDAEPVLHEFACWCAERALKRAEVKDRRSWAAVETKRRWLRGEATDDELAAARAAARDAAWDAAWAAARDAAWAAARDAARAAARDAARDAAWAAARDAAWAAEKKAQAEKLEQLLRAAPRLES